MPKKAIVFGVFDKLHEGHKHFLVDAARECDKLTVVLARAKAVKILKKRPPKQSFNARKKAILKFNPRLHVVPSEHTIGTWKILDRLKPDMVLLGYDQKEIARELKKRGIVYKFLDPFRPGKFKSSLTRS